MAIENERPDAPPPIEGFNMETNPFRPGRNYLSEPLSEFELNQLASRIPGSDLPSYESMLNANHETDASRAITFSPQEPVIPVFTPIYTPPKTGLSALTSEEKEKKEEEGQSAIGEVLEGLSFIFNPFKWF